jgi:hypothetical protein
VFHSQELLAYWSLLLFFSEDLFENLAEAKANMIFVE